MLKKIDMSKQLGGDKNAVSLVLPSKSLSPRNEATLIAGIIIGMHQAGVFKDVTELQVSLPASWTRAVSYTHLTLPTTPYV